MKNWEMVKELEKDSTKRFKLTNCNSNESINGIVKVVNNKICWDVSNPLEFPLHTVIGDNDDWKEVIEPVDFITAYNDCFNNGNNYVRNVAGIQAKMENDGGFVVITNAKDRISLNGYEWIKQ